MFIGFVSCKISACNQARTMRRNSDVQFIDYEYSGYNYLAYDIGNHFNEFAAKYSTIEFDFLGYAIVRFNQYFKMKPEVTALKVPE
ncbi:Ethanolamine kinase 1 [Galemys pyrenaicus]|uniref:ethanolamine kinase n=1 Tax=Galemys pyrenaicus TaxID=202257 RepID=A0A8J6A812_GALPY|nr:Ethanolamine kinase 1 [Galemys pyrenaicus]